MRIVIITPTRNEEKYLDTTIQCMGSQNKLPDKWIIVNDGSTDMTSDIVTIAQKKYPFINLINLPDRGFRKPAVGVIESFYTGLKTVDLNDYDVVAKFDSDLEFSKDMIEIICNNFKSNSKLGITGGTRYEQIYAGGPYEKVIVPRDFVGGPYKFYRVKCFQDIGGMICRAGWDGVDTIKANMLGWQTYETDPPRFRHLKSTGSAVGEGLKKACMKYGDVSYYMGGYIWYFLLRMLGRSVIYRNPKVGYYMGKGYLQSVFKRSPREGKEFRRFLRCKQKKNVMAYFKKILERNKDKAV